MSELSGAPGSEGYGACEDEGRDLFVTDEGDAITGRKAAPKEENRELQVAFVPHWATCPAAGDFRRRR